MLKLFLVFFLIIFILNPPLGLAFDTSDPSVSLLQNRISNNFSRKYCKAINNGLSKDEAFKQISSVEPFNIYANEIELHKGFDNNEI